MIARIYIISTTTSASDPILLLTGLLVKVNGKGYACAWDADRRDQRDCIE